MPHLTTPPATGQAATEAGRLGLGVPGYAHPLLAPVEWAELTRPGTPLHWAVLNVTDGPGGGPTRTARRPPRSSVTRAARSSAISPCETASGPSGS